MDLHEIAEQFDIDKVITVQSIGRGLVNDTYSVSTISGLYVMQKLHPIFKPEVLEDMDVVTQYLSTVHKMCTPVLVRTKRGEPYFLNGNDYWRMMTYISGATFQAGISTDQAYSAGRLVGRFHRNLVGLQYEFKHRIPGFHDIDYRVKEMIRALHIFENTGKYRDLLPIAEDILFHYERIDRSIYEMPDRIIHGDLKINNVMFDALGKNALTLIDLDTLGRSKIGFDLAHAIRTWANCSDRSDPDIANFDLQVVKDLLSGYRVQSDFTGDELRSVYFGTEIILLELSSRFVTDAFFEKYFRWDSFSPDLYTQNMRKARAQMNLFHEWQSHRRDVEYFLDHLCA